MKCFINIKELSITEIIEIAAYGDENFQVQVTLGTVITGEISSISMEFQRLALIMNRQELSRVVELFKTDSLKITLSKPRIISFTKISLYRVSFVKRDRNCILVVIEIKLKRIL